ncbi:MAG: DoxX family protein [Gemmatimonadota bacterium]
MTTPFIDVATASIGLLIVRVVFGLLMAAHGSQKLFGWFGGHGLAGTAGFFDSLGFRPGRFFATLASATEVTSGILLALGFLGPVGPALIISVMIVAAVSMHLKNGVFAANGGIEVPLLYGVVAAGLLLTGPGQYSLDAALGLGYLATPTLAWAALVVGVVGGIMNLFARRPVAA